MTLSGRSTSDTDESCVWYIAIIGHLIEITVCRDDRWFIIVSGTNTPSRSEERERWIYRKYDDERYREPLESAKCVRYRWYIDIGSFCSSMTSLMIWAYGQSSILGINMPTERHLYFLYSIFTEEPMQ
jgi:hypothetical protein